jgi:two-component system chemotaxis sensor kinase CheA
MDHGIESPEERERRGKPRMGTVTIQSSSAQGKLVIAVRDDGSGIDEEAILQRGRSMGLAAEAERRDVLAVLSHPGFSMKTEATPFSGRGVGLDLVRRRIGQIAGGA